MWNRVIFLLTLIVLPASVLSLPGAGNALKLILKVVNVYKNPPNQTDELKNTLFLNKAQRLTLTRLAEISDTLSRVELGVEINNGAIAMLLARTSGLSTRLELRLYEMSDLLSRMAAAEQRMREYMTIDQDLEQSTLESFASWCVSHEAGAVTNLLERLYSLVVSSHKYILGGSTFELILEDLQKDRSPLSHLQLSPHQLIYEMYNTIALTEIKGYAMMQMSWMMLKIYGKGNYIQETIMARRKYIERSTKLAAVTRSMLAVADRVTHRGDPPQHELGQTYDEVTRLIQGYVENEVDMNTGQTCSKNCAYYKSAWNSGCFKEQFCSKQSACRGRIVDCNYIDSHMWICLASRNSPRRYEWIKHYYGRTMGRVARCRRGTTKVDAWYRWIFWHCSYCMCLYDDDGPESHRYFSLRAALSNVEKNRVVTGLRLVKHGRVFHLQISEGFLEEKGYINASSWVPVQKFDIAENGISNGVDYYKLTYENRTINLGAVDSPAEHVLTGVRFCMVSDILHFEIRSTPFDYKTGRLAPKQSQWMRNRYTDDSRNFLELNKPDVPTLSKTPFIEISKQNQYVEFTHTDFESDAAQTTVPFIDIQPIEPMRGTALLSGAGILHRGSPGYGGFIAPQAITYSYKQHISNNPRPDSVLSHSDMDLPKLTLN